MSRQPGHASRPSVAGSFSGRPGTRRAKLAALLDAHGPRGLTHSALLAAYARAYPTDAATHDALSAALGQLLQDRAVQLVGAERGRGRYIYRGDYRSAIGPDFRRHVAELVNRLYRETNAPVPTRLVREALRNEGRWPYRFARLFAVLDGLSKRNAVSANPGHTIRRVRSRQNPDLGSARWVPRNLSSESSILPATRAAALRHTVGDATARLGPCSLQDLRWWLNVHPSGATGSAALRPRSIGVALRNVAARDAGGPGEAGRLHVLVGPLTCHGGAPERYLLGPPDALQRRSCHLEDALMALQLRDEIGLSGAALARWPASRLVGNLLAIRRRLAYATLKRLSDGPDHHTLSETVRRLEEVVRARAQLVADAHGLSYAARYARREQVRKLGDELAAATTFLAGARNLESLDPDMRVSGVLDDRAVISLPGLRALSDRLASTGELRSRRPALIYASARRFPASRLSVPMSSAHGLQSSDRHSVIDRVDALVTITRRGVPDFARRATQDALTALGTVLRDPAVLLTELTLVQDREEPARAACVVALGALGRIAPLHLAMPRSDEPELARAYCVATVLATLDGARALRILDAAARGAVGDAHRVIDVARSRLSVGLMVSLAEDA